MSAGLLCPHCGHVNARAGVFCAQCGGKMGQPDLQQASGFSAGRIAGMLVRWVLGLALAAVIALLARPQDVPNVPADEPLGRTVAERLRRLREAGEQGQLAAAVFDQKDLNAYLSWRLAETPEAGRSSGMGLAIRRLHVTLDQPDCTLRVLGGLGPVRLSFTVRVHPTAAEGGGTLQPGAAWIGHLPVPGPAVPWVASRMAPLFSEMHDARSVVTHLARIETRSGQVRVGVGPTGP